MAKRFLKIISILVAAFATLLVFVILFFSSSPGENIIKNRIVKTINEQSGLSVSISKFETNLFSRVQLDETTVVSAGSAESDSLLGIKKIILKYSLFDLLIGDVNLESVVIDDVNLNISVDSLGNYGIPLLDAPREEGAEESGSSVALSVEIISLNRLNAYYNDKRIPIDINLYNLSSKITGLGNNEYNGILTADSILSRYESAPILLSDLNCDFWWEAGRLSVNTNAAIEKLGLTVEASSRFPQLDSLTITASIEGDPSDIIDIVENKFEFPDLEMKYVLINAKAEGSIETPEIILDISSPLSRVENIDLTDFQLHTRYSSKKIYIDTAGANLLGGGVTARGSISLEETSTTALDLVIKGISLSELWPAVYKSESPFVGNLRGTVRAEGKIDSIAGWDIAGKLNVSKPRYQGIPADDLNLEFSLLNDSAQITLIHARDSVITEAVLKNGDIAGRFYANIPEISAISRFADIPDLRGNITANGTFGGSINNPFLNVNLKGDKLLYLNFPMDDLAADLQYRDSILIINNLRLSGIRPDSLMYQPIMGMDSLYGMFEYDCEFRGSSDYMEGDISARIASLEYSGYKIDSAYTSATIRGSKINIDSLNIFFKDLVFKSSGSYDTVSAAGLLKTGIFSILANEDYKEDAKSRYGFITTGFALLSNNDFRFDIECDSLWLGLMNSFAVIDAPENGFLDLRVNFEGNPAEPHGSLSATAYSISHPSYEIDSIIVKANIADEYLDLSELRLFVYGNTISAGTKILLDRDPENHLIFSDEATFSGELTADNLDLSILGPYLTPTGEITGSASIEMSWDGTMKDPGLEGSVNVDNGYIKYGDLADALENFHLRLILSDSVLTIDSASCYSGGTPLSVKGTVKYKLPDQFDISAKLSANNLVLLSVGGKVLSDSLDLRIYSNDLELDILSPFMTMADSLGGILNSEAIIAGKANAPKISGFLTVSEFRLFSKELSAAIEAGFLDIRFDKTRVDIDSLYVKVNGGSVVMTGFLVHDGATLTDIDLGLKASDISYEKAGAFKGKLQFANLNYGRKEDQYILDGDISFGESRLTAKFPLKSILPWARSVETVEYELPDIISRTRLNVRFRENDDLWVDNNLANIRMKAELGIIGTPAKPILSGLVSIEEGYLIYLDNKFAVEEGRLIFSDPLRINPEITLRAKTQKTTYQRTVAEKYVVYILIEGDLENPRTDIYSEPPLSKPDIIALLTLGATRSELAGGENQGGLRGALVDRASRLTSNRVSGYISDKVGSLFGFDEFTVEGNLFKFDNSWGPRLVASRRISKKVELTYSTTVGHLNDQGVRLGYKLTPSWSIQGETDQAGRSGIDLRYGVKFK